MKINKLFQFFVFVHVIYAGILCAADSEQKGYGAVDHRSMNAPLRNTLFSCEQAAMGQTLSRSWLDGNGVISFGKKPVVEGGELKDSRLEIRYEGDMIVINGNGVPEHPVGQFPVRPDSEAFQYDRNPNSIQAYTVQYQIPLQPEVADQPGCLPMGAIGIALSGSVFFNPLDAYFRDAVANEIFDQCEGHPQQRGVYHYHHASPCLDQGDKNTHSPLIGYALDGFGIYGSRGENGRYLSNVELDECHGHYGTVTDRNNTLISVYHYHANDEFPYLLGCFKGAVEQKIIKRPPRVGANKARPQRRQGMHRPDLGVVAKRLGISIQKLRAALGAPPPDYRRAAQRLGIKAETLHSAMREAGAP